ncbi:MAG: inverse autotransporter beta domain-containing protein [Hyphomicrobiales bacterium]|nr:inverse autotransporter beta domain-containing protein [Hyphomicrobiales bacterium]
MKSLRASRRISAPAIILTFLAIVLSPLAHAAEGARPPESARIWSPWVEFGGYYGSDKASRGEAALFMPLWQNPTSMLFTDIRGKLFEDDVREGNFALGWRHMLSSGWNFGIWGGYDVRRSQTGNSFPQVSGGLELLGDSFDVRFNGYLPLQDEKTLTSTTAMSSVGTVALTGGGTGIAMTTTTTATTTISKELALWGVDGEIGMRLFGTDPAAPGLRAELRAYAGGFYFDHADLPGQVAGPKARLELRIDDLTSTLPGSRLTVESEFSYDDVRKDKWEVGARLRIPFGTTARVASLTPQERRMTEALERDTDIVTQNKTTTTSAANTIQESVIDNETDVALNTVAIVNAGGSISTASTNAGDNSLILVRGNVTGAQTVQGSQTVLGSGTGLQVRGATTGMVATFTDPGATPTLSGSGFNPQLQSAGSNLHIAGLNITGSGDPFDTNNNGFRVGSNQTNVLINDVAMTATGGNAAIWMDFRNTVTLRDVTITNALHHGIFAFSPRNTITMNRVMIDSPGEAGIRLSDENNNVTIDNSTFTNIGAGAGQYAVVIAHSGNSVNGAGNMATAGRECFGSPPWTGTIVINGTSFTSANCP